mmetsp:Transcript_26102/g.82695  ORF Transcript_26102/g.82695 Transcript_26102/m.82695 type:complete len:299 (-) Transcript_26102:658-1554(-)
MKPAGQPADGGGGRSDSNCAGAGTCDGVSVDAAILRSSASNSAHTCTSSASSRSASSTSSAPPPTAAVAVASAAAAATSSSAASSSALATSTAAWSAARSGPLPAWSSYSSTPSTPPLCAGGAGALLSASCTAAVARALAPASAGSKLQKAGGSRRPILTGLASYAHQCRSSATAATITLHAASLSSPPKLPLAPPRRRKRRVARAAAQSASESGSSCTSALVYGSAWVPRRTWARPSPCTTSASRASGWRCTATTRISVPSSGAREPFGDASTPGTPGSAQSGLPRLATPPGSLTCR